jgi:hypothetical protein
MVIINIFVFVFLWWSKDKKARQKAVESKDE